MQENATVSPAMEDKASNAEIPKKESKARRISRRMFMLLLGESAIAGFLAGWGGTTLGKEAAKDLPEFEHVETDQAHFFIYYSQHNRPPSVQDFQSVGKLDLHLAEYVIRTNNNYASSDIWDVVNTPITTPEYDPKNPDPNEIIRPHIVDPETISYFRQEGTLVGIEGLAFPKELMDLNDSLINANALAGIAAFLMSLSEDVTEKQRVAEREYQGWNRRDFLQFIKRAVAGTAGVWAISPVLMKYFTDARIFDPRKGGKIQEAIRALTGVIQALHPENYRFFFRELMFSLQADSFIQYFKEQKGQEFKPWISMDIGNYHTSLKYFLDLPKPFKLAILTHYPQASLNVLVNANLGLTNFCTARALDPRTPNTGATEEGIKVFDQEMYDVLSGYLDRQD